MCLGKTDWETVLYVLWHGFRPIVTLDLNYK